MYTRSAAAALVIACQLVSAAQEPPTPVAPPAPPAPAPEPAAETPQSIRPKFEFNRTTEYTVTCKGTTSVDRTTGAAEFADTVISDSSGEWTSLMRVRPLRHDPRTDHTEIEVQFGTFKGVFDHGDENKFELDTAKRFIPKPRQRQRRDNKRQDDDKDVYNGVPVDRLVDDYFRKMNGARMLLRVDARGEIVSTSGGEALNARNFAFQSVPNPHSAIASLFGPFRLNDEKAAAGSVKSGDQWTHTVTFNNNNAPNVQPTRIITRFTVQSTTPTRVEISAKGERQPNPSDPPGGSIQKTETTQYIWDPAAGQLTRMAQTVVSDHAFNTSKMKGRNIFRTASVIERVEPKAPVPAAPKPPPPAKKPKG